jgi:hypothetical protein
VVDLREALRLRARVETGEGHRLVNAVRLGRCDCKECKRRCAPLRVVPDIGLRVGVVPPAPRVVTAGQGRGHRHAPSVVAMIIMYDVGGAYDESPVSREAARARPYPMARTERDDRGCVAHLTAAAYPSSVSSRRRITGVLHSIAPSSHLLCRRPSHLFVNLISSKPVATIRIITTTE